MVMYLFTCGFVCDNSNVYSNKKQTKKVMCIVTVTKCSEADIRGYITVQGITRCAWCSCSPWACTRMVWRLHTCLNERSRARLLQKNCAGRFLLDNRRCCTTLAKVRRLQTRKEPEQSKVALLEIHWPEDSPAQPLVERDGLRVCAVQWAERLYWPGRWCSLFTAATML